MTKEAFRNELHISEGFKFAKEALKTGLKINWETDLSKIDFSALGYHITDLINTKVEMVDLPEDFTKLHLFESEGPLLNGDDRSIAYFAYLVKSGVKVIPPYYERNWEINDGVLHKSKLFSIDGNHRISFCKLLGYESIPMIVKDSLRFYVFSIDRWIFEFRDKYLDVIEVDGNKKFEIDINDIYGCEALLDYKLRIFIKPKYEYEGQPISLKTIN